MKVILKLIIVCISFTVIKMFTGKIFGENNVFIFLIWGIPFSIFALIYVVSGNENNK